MIGGGLQSNMYNPFFTIITRTFCRPSMLSIGIQSVIDQTCNDCEQIFLIDKIGDHKEGNVLWANSQFSKCSNKIDGVYVMALDDDGRFIVNNHLEKVKNHIVNNDFPDVVLVKSHTIKNLATNEYHYLPPSPHSCYIKPHNDTL